MTVPRFWRRINSLYRLEGTKCRDCGQLYFPSRERCVECNSLNVEPYLFEGTGEIITFSWVYTAPKGFENRTPYCLAIVELTEGPRLTTQIIGLNKGEVKIGMEVEFAFRRIASEGEEGIIKYGFKFQPKDYPNHSIK
ncbi:MAG: Zn-ribbon domain-containing OB-fold protein [Asgard group archaeon]|nr:Zn-ribbon domain-containing OB-fold protein [Asgard group archaeon]